MVEFEAIVFDFGDTIATLRPSKGRIVKDFLSLKNIDISIEEITNAYRIVDYCHKQSALKLRNPKKKRAFLLKLNSELLKVLGLAKADDLWAPELYEFFQVKKRWELFSDVVEVLAYFQRQGYKMAILANWDKSLKTLVKGLGIDRFFLQILSSEESLMEKPDPRIFLHPMKLISVNPKKTVYVGNEYETDVLGSRAAGLVPVLIDRNRFWPHADCLRFESLSELVNYF